MSQINSRENLDLTVSVINRYKKVLDKIEAATTQNEISTLEREAYAYVRELQMVGPRLGMDLNAVSQRKRREIATAPAPTLSSTRQQVHDIVEDPKPVKKTTRRKTTKKAKK